MKMKCAFCVLSLMYLLRLAALAFLIFTQRGVGTVLNDLGFGGDVTTALITLGAMLLFYWRIRLPFCMALIALAGLYLAGAIVNAAAPEFLKGNLGIGLFISGFIIFIIALLYDMNDKHRTTRFADNAFCRCAPDDTWSGANICNY